ncbi:hypothetical protein, partial [Halomonas tibetensis]
FDASGNYTLTVTGAMNHAEGEGENWLSLPTITFTGYDGDGDAASVDLNARVRDDVPLDYTPDIKQITNLGGEDITGDLNTLPGADGTKSITIDGVTYNGVSYTEENPEMALTSGGESITLSGFGTSLLTGSTNSGDVFKLSLNPDDVTYTFNLLGTIDDGSGITSINLAGVNSGNPAFLRSDTPTDDFDLLFSSKSNGNFSTVNSSQSAPLSDGSVGVGTGQTLNDGDILAIDFVTDLTIGKQGGQDFYNYSDRYELAQFSFTVSGSGAVTVRAATSVNTDVAGTNQADHSTALWDSNGITQEQIDSISVNGQSVDPGSLIDDGSGGFTITGLTTLDVVTVGVSNGFNRLEIENLASIPGDNYDIGNFGYSIISAGSDIPLTFDTTLIDGDGDAANGSIDVTIEPSDANAAPIALDLDGDGVEYLSLDAGVMFADDSTGESVNTAWVGADDGLLVIDANNSGTVDETREYVFTEWSETAKTDMEAVREVFDTNNNGMLDPGDEAWSQFAVWQDANSDGKTDAGELVSLGELGVESIELNYGSESEARTDADGDVIVFGQSQVNWTDGSVTIAEDASFAITASEVFSEEADEDLFQGDGSSSHAKADASYSGEQADVPATGATSFEDLDTSNNSIE